MLLELHVKNLALIEQADLELGEGLTILSGETGAGKSILIDSINVALGARTDRSIIRNGADCAYIELVFSVEDKEKLDRIRAMDIAAEDDGVLIISRKITPAKSLARINDETVTGAKLRELTGLLLDMHGQFEHQSLLTPASHLEFIDKMSSDKVKELKSAIAERCSELNSTCRVLDSGSDKVIRDREADILRYEVREIEEAGLREGEEEELLEEFRRMKNSSKICTALGSAAEELDNDHISRAVKGVGDAAAYDERLEEIRKQLEDIESLVYDAKHGIDEYLKDFEYDEERFAEIGDRLDVIHRLQGKYGDSIGKIAESLADKKERLAFLEDYDTKREQLIKKKSRLEAELNGLCGELSSRRKETAERLRSRIAAELTDLNFPGVKFDIQFSDTGRFTPSGRDTAQFMISTNPGQPIRPLKDVASGGELSRIMLALKTVLADTDEIETLIFDEIDAGISGRTAARVAEKLHAIGRGHQVLCITHLPQIAAMADNHYLISKSTDGASTRTMITRLTEEESVAEIARMMGGEQLSETVLDAAREMKRGRR